MSRYVKKCNDLMGRSEYKADTLTRQRAQYWTEYLANGVRTGRLAGRAIPDSTVPSQQASN